MILSNSTPIIAFSKIGQLPLLKKVVHQLTIPNAVFQELSAYPQNQLGIALAQELRPQLVLIDELTGRNIAKSLF